MANCLHCPLPSLYIANSSVVIAHFNRAMQVQNPSLFYFIYLLFFCSYKTKQQNVADQRKSERQMMYTHWPLGAVVCGFAVQPQPIVEHKCSSILNYCPSKKKKKNSLTLERFIYQGNWNGLCQWGSTSSHITMLPCNTETYNYQKTHINTYRLGGRYAVVYQ